MRSDLNGVKNMKSSRLHATRNDNNNNNQMHYEQVKEKDVVGCWSCLSFVTFAFTLSHHIVRTHRLKCSRMAYYMQICTKFIMRTVPLGMFSNEL